MTAFTELKERLAQRLRRARSPGRKRVLVHEIVSIQVISAALVGTLAIASLYWGGQWILQDNYSRWALQWTAELNELGAPLYLADDSELAGVGRYGKACVLQWMFFEQYSHEPYIATSRFIVQYLGNPADRQADLESKRSGGHKALSLMDGHLAGRDFFANDAYSIADIALYAYTHVAHEGGFDLGNYANIAAWLMRVQQQENHVPMKVRKS